MASRNAKGRMIYWKISYCKQLARCSTFSKLLFTWLIPNTDDLGRMEGDPEVIKGMIFPYEEKVSVKQIRESLEELAFEKLILWYLVDDNMYIQFPNFSIYQNLRKDRQYKSDYPDPVDVDMTSHDKSGLVGQNLREGKEKVRRSEGEGKESEAKPVKKIFGEKVLLSDDEYQKLVTQHGEQEVNYMISILDNWYLTKGKKPNKSDYHTMVGTGWVLKRFKEEQPKIGNKTPGDKTPGKTSGKYENFYL
ncbi:hypothetical protein [Desulfosporosinus youngiae]|uniref:DnaD-like protein n=1 Tax=Desulfosporosinus youngiae DSM 17734 TaxID=768710 RepID=H5Y253_9FIRM|nr:hypothetical protein [Desulfosporosinus youngiae]EHQ88251.1 hypothetical protein DesyoDRAFT_1080 [Desulfosporosinus youngiae DSM 17734]